MKLALRPIGKNAPPRPRRFDASSSSMTASGSIPRALSSALSPPAARYSEIRVRSRSSAPSSTTASSGTAQLLDDRRHVVRPHRLAVAVVDGDDGPPPAAAGALERAEREASVVGCLARLHPVLLLCHPQSGQHRRARFRVLGGGLLDPLCERHRSTSPMTVSSDPTIAMKSAISASRMHVAVAWSATNDGARNLTRHGRGPPSD